jgi:hypothetical protein
MNKKPRKITKEEIQQMIREEYKNHIITEGILGWIVDKVADGLNRYVNKRADYQYDALFNDKSFKSLASRYGYKNEEEWVKKAKELVKKDPQKFADTLAYDVRKGDFGKYFK